MTDLVPEAASTELHTAGGGARAASHTYIHPLQTPPPSPQDRVTDLVAEAERRQQSYMRREGELEQQAKALQGELDLARGVRPQGSAGVVPPVDAIKSLHGQVRGKGVRGGELGEGSSTKKLVSQEQAQFDPQGGRLVWLKSGIVFIFVLV